MDPTERWDFEVFYSCHFIRVPRHGRLFPKLRKRVWNVLGQELSVEKLFRTDGSCMWMLGSLLSELHLCFDESDFCLFIFIFALAFCQFELGLGFRPLDWSHEP